MGRDCNQSTCWGVVRCCSFNSYHQFRFFVVYLWLYVLKCVCECRYVESGMTAQSCARLIWQMGDEHQTSFKEKCAFIVIKPIWAVRNGSLILLHESFATFSHSCNLSFSFYSLTWAAIWLAMRIARWYFSHLHRYGAILCAGVNKKSRHNRVCTKYAFLWMLSSRFIKDQKFLLKTLYF